MTDAPPLAAVRVIEFEGLGPVPFAAMLLADMGADVVRIARPGTSGGGDNPIDRGRRTVRLDLALAEDRQTASDLIARADVVLEGFRPGVLERLGFAPDRLLTLNPALVIGRMTAWGQDGPLARMPAHDLNILAMTGALAAIGSRERPAIPLNIVADYGGGALYLVTGILAALLAARNTGRGRTVDAAMSEGTLSLLSLHVGMWQSGRAALRRGDNMLDGGAPFYAVYRCADEGFVAVAAIEAKFYANLLSVLDLSDDPAFARQHDRSGWAASRDRLEAIFAARRRDEWTVIFGGVEACVTPVLTLQEAMELPHFLDRGAFIPFEGGRSPGPAPRFTDTSHVPPSFTEADADDLRREWATSPSISSTGSG